MGKLLKIAKDWYISGFIEFGKVIQYGVVVYLV